MKFKDILKQLRTDNGFSAKQLATELKFSISIIYEWEHGRCEPSLDALIKLSAVFVPFT